ncbi:T9SS type A sorting domain-containing protein, partial [candidate division WOR-3 bacterium]|nr:T9SS type A sorting domain-containing protein [candidate division WOR-3 bacterium]
TGINRRINNGNTPDVSVFKDGSFIITYWYNYDISCQMFYPTGDTSGGLITVNDTTEGYRYYPSIDMDTTGNFIITWRDYRNGDSDIYAQRFNSSGDTTGVNFRVDDDLGTFTQESPDIAINKSGRFLIVWHDQRNGNYDIYGQVYTVDGSPVGSNFLINDDIETSTQQCPCVSTLRDDNFIVAWEDYRTPRGIYGQVIDTLGNPVDPNFQIADGSCYYSAVDVSPDSGFVVVWYQYDYPEYDIYAQRFNTDCTPDSTTYKVNNDTEGLNTLQYRPDVATDGTNIIFTWQDPKWQKGYDIAAKVVGWDFTSIDEIKPIIRSISLLPNIPNPFAKSTTIRYSVDKTREVKIRIYDIAGKEVCTLFDGKVDPGIHQVTWSGMNSKGKVPAGIYFCQLKSGNKIQSRKIVLLR